MMNMILNVHNDLQCILAVHNRRTVKKMCGFYIHPLRLAYRGMHVLSGEVDFFVCFAHSNVLIQQFPLVWEWWVTHVVASVAMASLGEYLCARSELQDIPLYSGP